MQRRWFLSLGLGAGVFIASFLTTGCAEPPQKEMSRAEGAIQAAKAAGAETYAAEEFANAQRALERSEAAVEEADYRQALSHALDALEQAELAAGTAATQKAKARGDLDARMTALSTALDEMRLKLEAAMAARIPEARLKAPRASLTALQHALQEARSARDAGDLQKAAAQVDGMDGQFAALASSLEALREAPRPSRRAR
jgi:hypothetical protein